MKLLKFITTFRHVMEKMWRDLYPSQCPVAVMIDGEPSLACMHYLKDDTCPIHGKVYASEKPLTMTPELAQEVMWKPTKRERFEDKAGEFYFDVDLSYQVFKARKERGWSVVELNVDISHTHPMVGKRLLLTDGEEVTVKTMHRQWWYGAYTHMVAEDDGGSSVVLKWEDISLFDPEMKEQVIECRSRVKKVLN